MRCWCRPAPALKSGAVCVAYETITGPGGGMGLLLGGVPGVPPAHVVILGAGVVGSNALPRAVGCGARVTIFDRNIDRLRHLDLIFGNRVETASSTAQALDERIPEADLVIGGMLIPGAAAPKLVTRQMVAGMKNGAVVVDVHYCVASMPGAVARTSTFALNNATIGHAVAIADKGWKRAAADDPHLRNGLNVVLGKVTHEAVARALGHDYTDANGMLA